MKSPRTRLLLGLLTALIAPLAHAHSGIPLPILIAFPWGILSFLMSTFLFLTTTESGKRKKQFLLCIVCFPLWMLVFIGPINLKLWEWAWELIWALSLPCLLLIAAERISHYRIKRNIKLDENRLSVPINEGPQLKEMKVASSAGNKPKKLTAQFSSIRPEGISFNQAVIDQECDCLRLSVYEGGSYENLVLIQSYVATDWKTLSLYLNSNTCFREGDFHIFR